MMPEPVRLSDVFLSPNFGPTEPHCMIYANGALDELEYGLGVERGWLLSSLSKESDHFEMIWEDMNEDVCQEMKGGRIALLPESDVISKMLTLRHHNYYCPLNERRPFYEELPFTDYIYTLLPAVFPSPQALYIKDKDAFPSPLPTNPVVRIKSRLHPLILLENAAFYALMLQSRPELKHIVDQDTYKLLISANTPSFGRVQESWLNLGDVEGNRKFSKRRAVYYIPDIVRTEKVKKVKKRVKKVQTNDGEAELPVARKRVKKVKKVLVDSKSESKPLNEVN